MAHSTKTAIAPSPANTPPATTFCAAPVAGVIGALWVELAPVPGAPLPETKIDGTAVAVWVKVPFWTTPALGAVLGP